MSTRSLAVLYTPEYTGYSSHQEFMSPFESQLSCELLFPIECEGSDNAIVASGLLETTKLPSQPPWSPEPLPEVKRTNGETEEPVNPWMS